ncbi:hypothetical protein MKK63_12385 [Methylobacterium sp. J-088]|uniref:hypothetical protein n=1 Tax=Methylobacterium sp. J-088 TaxID=2836664 RepID=UPI001FB894B1|nr:hypothetical protein [Methylobacterium sp. J-088]MCJ2063504.1 hypothetical protein [Methylobacterium sp. J-088]
MKMPSFLEVPEMHEDHVTLVPYCPHPGGEITAVFLGPFEKNKDLFESERMPIKEAIEAAQRRAKSKKCDVVVLDHQKLWDPAHGDLI